MSRLSGFFVLIVLLRAENLTLDEAEARALRQNPSLAYARANVRAAMALPKQTSARLAPQLDGIITGSIAEHGSRMGVGGINAPDLFSRLGMGFGVTQLITDFGRTSLLARSSEANASATEQSALGLSAEIRLQVRSAYYRALAAEAGRTVARQTIEARQSVLRQARAFAESNLRSTLDVGFAEVRVAEAQLLLTRTDNAARASLIELAQVMGDEGPGEWQLRESPATPLEILPENVVREALSSRPEILALKSRVEAARRQLESDSRLQYPTLTASGVAGVIPEGDSRLRSRYLGVGINLNLPILNGGVFGSRREESAARLAAVEAELQESKVRIAATIRRALLELETARQNVLTVAQLEAQANRVLRLADERYRAGLGTIIEFNQAQIDVAAARLAAAGAHYEVRIREEAVAFEAGWLSKR